MSDALEWLEAHRGKPLTTYWYIERDAETPGRTGGSKGSTLPRSKKSAPMPADVELGREGTWLVIYNPNFTRILDGTAIAGARFEADEKRLVIAYGRRRSVLEERDVG